MKATTNATQPATEHPPLARDPQGNLLAIPEGTAAWRVCRHTKGRPRIINGPDKQPARFPLDTTADELADACGADTYRLYAVDGVGNVIDYVTTIEMTRELRNAGEADVALVPAPRATATSTSDLRYALEAVTHMARTNAEAMRAVAESQADWIKSISSARGFFRNAPPPLQLPPPVEAQSNDDDEDEDDDDDDDHGSDTVQPNWIDQLQPIVGEVVKHLITAFMTPKPPAAAGEQASSPKFSFGDVFDWRRAARKHQERQQAGEQPEPPMSPAALQQAIAGKAMAIGAQLEPAERARLMKLAPMLMKLSADPEISRMLAELVSMSVEDSVAWVRANIDAIERGLAS